MRSRKKQVPCEYKSPAHEAFLDQLGPTFIYTTSIFWWITAVHAQICGSVNQITQLLLDSLHHINISWSMVRHSVFTSSKPGATFQIENSYWHRVKPLLQGFVLWFSYMELSEALYSQHFSLYPRLPPMIIQVIYNWVISPSNEAIPGPLNIWPNTSQIQLWLCFLEPLLIPILSVRVPIWNTTCLK